jgi:3-phenylpropionate/trans-cinnamate dioxygenase ferredoxin reductase subunit
MNTDVKYLLIGAGLAAHFAMRGIRERDKEGRILIVGAEPELPYTRPHLSKGYLMGKRERAKVFVKPIEFYRDDMKAEVWLDRRVTSIDAAKKIAQLADGTSIAFERALIATGAEPRRLSIPGADLSGVFYLRTLADSDAIKGAMESAKRAVVIGSGFIGAEAASALAQKNIDTMLILPDDVLLKRQVGPAAAEFLTKYFEAKGVKLVKNKKVSAITGSEKVSGVKTEDGSDFSADLVVAGIGVAPRIELAQAAGLKVDRGVIVNGYLQTSDPSLYAVGDIALYEDKRYSHALRLEHWDNAIAMGKAAGLNMAGAQQPFDHVPYFYSDLFDLDLQAYGDLYQWDRVIVRGALGHNLTYFYVYQLDSCVLMQTAQRQAAANDCCLANK